MKAVSTGVVPSLRTVAACVQGAVWDTVKGKRPNECGGIGAGQWDATIPHRWCQMVGVVIMMPYWKCSANAVVSDDHRDKAGTTCRW